MQKFEFKYTRRTLFCLLLMLSLALIVLLAVGAGNIGMGAVPVLVIFAILFPTSVMILVLVAEAKGGYCIFHEKFVEIGLGKKVYEVDYNHIEGVDYEYFRWVLKIDGQRNIGITASLSTTSNKIVEHFMETLQRRAAASGELKANRTDKYEFRYKNYPFSFAVAIPSVLLFIFFLAWMEPLFGFRLQGLYAILFLVGLFVFGALPFMFMTFRGIGTLHKDHVEIQFWRRSREIEYIHIKEVYRAVGLRGPDYWIIKIHKGWNIHIAIVARRRDDKHIEHFMDALKQRVSNTNSKSNRAADGRPI